MPDLLGTELMAQIRSKNLNIDIIIISAAKEKEIIEKAIHFGAFDYIIKPVKMERFIDTLNRYKKVKESLEKDDTIDQSVLDKYFGYYTSDEFNHNEMTPKGIDPITLRKVNDCINDNITGFTAEEVGIKVGVSRTT